MMNIFNKENFVKSFNILSNALYPIVGWLGDWSTFMGGMILALGSGWMHYEEEFKGGSSRKSQLADWTGMFAFFIAILAYVTNPAILLLMIPILMLKYDMMDRNLIGLVALSSMLITQSWIAIALFGLALYIRDTFEHSKYQDITHSVWHFLTALGGLVIIRSITYKNILNIF